MGRFCYFDVDDTLILYDLEAYPKLPQITITDPYDGSTRRFAIHTKHVEWLEKMSKRGETIVVWSAGGVKWANAVVIALGITRFVNFVLAKPDTIYDDDPRVFYSIPRWQKP
jgi:hypothetical protein